MGNAKPARMHTQGHQHFTVALHHAPMQLLLLIIQEGPLVPAELHKDIPESHRQLWTEGCAQCICQPLPASSQTLRAPLAALQIHQKAPSPLLMGPQATSRLTLSPLPPISPFNLSVAPFTSHRLLHCSQMISQFFKGPSLTPKPKSSLPHPSPQISVQEPHGSVPAPDTPSPLLAREAAPSFTPRASNAPKLLKKHHPPASVPQSPHQ